MGSVEKAYLNRIELFFVKILCLAWTWLIDKRVPKPTSPYESCPHRVCLSAQGEAPLTRRTQNPLDASFTLI